jgi:type II secretory pathway pseudopilin PulG
MAKTISEIDSRPSFCCRRGMTLVETGVSLVVLMVAMMALAQLVGMAARQRRASQERQLAIQEVANQAERIAVLPYDQVAAEKLTSWEPSAEVSAAIPRIVCRAIVSDEEGSPPARRVQLRVTWTNGVGQEVEPVELTVWRFRPEKRL